ncbi:MAG: PAS domain-containing sensor histidine kinase [Candidatus Muiribacteriota bacterium]
MNINYLDKILNSSDDIIFLLNGDFIFEKVWSDNKHKLFFREEEIIQKNISQLFDGKILKTFIEKLNKVKKSGNPQYTQYKSPFSKNKWFKAKICGFYDNYTCIDKFLIFVSEITEFKKSEEKLKESRQRYKHIVNTQNELICRWLPDTTITFVNQAYCDFFNKSEEELIGNKWTDFLTEEALKKINFEKFKKLKTPISYEHEVISSSGEKRIQSWTDFPIFNLDDEVIGFQSTGVDITELKNTQGKLKRAKIMSENANQAKADFIANVSHEIKTPLSVITGYTHVLKKNVFDKDLKKYCNKILKASNILLDLMNDILDFSKIEAGKMVLEPVNFNLTTFFKKTINVVLLKLREKKLNLYIKFEPHSLIYLKADRDRIQQIIINILTNAIKFTHDGYILIEVSVDKKNATKCLLNISISDTGIGIKKSYLNSIFDSFSQVDSSIKRRYSGTGLGLSIVKKLINLLNGEINVKSQVGKGTCFNFSIPVEFLNETSLKIETLPGQVLIISNDKVQNSIIEKILSIYNIKTEFIDDFDSFKSCFNHLKKQKRKKTDIIIIDIDFYTISQVQDIPLIRENKDFKNTPLLILQYPIETYTESSSLNEIEKSFFLQKPLFHEVLLKKIEEITKSNQC